MKIGDAIRRRRLELGLTLEQVGDAVGVAKSTVKKWESGHISNMRRDRIDGIARILQVSPAVLITDSEVNYNTFVGKNSELPDNILPLPKTKQVPLLGTIACGEPIYADENIEEYLPVPEDVKADFCLRCKGDSMIGARIHDGDVVYIHAQETVDNGQIAAVVIGDEATLKRVYISDGTIMLSAANEAYDPLIYVGPETEQVRIIGRAVAFLSQVR